MSKGGKIYKYITLKGVVQRLRDDLRTKDFVLLYAYNGTGKTRTSMAFKEEGKRKNKNSDENLLNGYPGDTLYFNAYTEDLFHWDNDLEGDKDIKLMMNRKSRFFDGFEGNALEERIRERLHRYARFNFKIDYQKPHVRFYNDDRDSEAIKISRGEENIFIWCVYLALCELAVDGAESYKWVKFFYIDDPISSLDDNNVITVACDLANLIKRGKDRIKTVISTHHGLFFNVMCNELDKYEHKKYFMHCDKKERFEKEGDAEKIKYEEIYYIKPVGDTPFLHHIYMIKELLEASEKDKLYTYHFNMLRSVLEKTAAFFGYDNFSACISDVDDEILYARALNLMSHDKFSPFKPRVMVDDNKDLFRKILNAFKEKYKFSLPEYKSEHKEEVKS